MSTLKIYFEQQASDSKIAKEKYLAFHSILDILNKNKDVYIHNNERKQEILELLQWANKEIEKVKNKFLCDDGTMLVELECMDYVDDYLEPATEQLTDLFALIWKEETERVLTTIPEYQKRFPENKKN